MKVLVTGGAGFIGSHSCEKLIELGHQVVCLDNFNDYYNPDIKRKNISSLSAGSNFHLMEGDIRDKAFLDTVFTQHKIALVIHLAAMAGVRPSIADPELYYDVNVNGTLFLLESMKKYDVTKLLFASSSSVYGNNKKVPFSETDNVDFPISPYAASKKAGELLCHTYHHLYRFDISCLRFFTVYGPRQRPDLAIHKFTNAIAAGKTIDMYGDGSTARDYTYIDDIVSGIIAAMNHIGGYEIFNLGESQTISLSEMIVTIEKHLDKKANKNYMPMQPGDVNITWANVSKAKMSLGYNPQKDFDDGIVEFIKWKQL
ncbi:MAG: epimerase [Bacteroidetes bacterium]|nr:MAG: epimerase [Bacteroidota bacterium]